MAGPSDDEETHELSFASQVEKFDFYGDAIDTALRKLLAKVVLPKEAQQIDRAMEDFAKRYYKCNSTLVDNPDIVYAVAFSLILLHTDAHNKNVRQKMNKDTFIMRTKIIEGGEAVPHEILDVMYDNIVVSEFTYADAGKESTGRTERSNSWFSKLKNSDSTSTNVQNVKIALLNDLSQKLEQLMPAENTFSYKRSLKPIPIMEIHFSLLKAKSLCLSGVRSRHGYENSSNTFTIRVTKAGIMDRKYDLVQGGKKATARSWRPFGVILSGSQIIFFGDISAFQTYLDRDQTLGSSSDLLSKRNNSFPAFSSISSMDQSSTSLHSYNESQLITPIPTISSSTNTISSSFQSYLRPVQIVSLSYAVCIYDDSYKKYPYTFRLITGDGQQFLLRADNEKDMEDWMLKINYAATLKTTGVRIKPTSKRQEQKQSIEKIKVEDQAKEKVEELTSRIDEQVRILDRELQLRRNLMVLQPFQKATKDRIISFADTLGKRIRTKRIELQRLQCYRDYLECELNWYTSQKQSRKMSLPSYHYSLIPPAIANATNSASTLPIIKNDHHAKKIDSSMFQPTTPIRRNLIEPAPSSALSKENDKHIKVLKEEETTPQIPPFKFSVEPLDFEQETTKPKVVSDKAMEIDRIMRRRSQSNPIIPNSRSHNLIDKKLLLTPKQAGRQRSGSEASSVQGDDDDLSVVIINDTEDIIQ